MNKRPVSAINAAFLQFCGEGPLLRPILCVRARLGVIAAIGPAAQQRQQKQWCGGGGGVFRGSAVVVSCGAGRAAV